MKKRFVRNCCMHCERRQVSLRDPHLSPFCLHNKLLSHYTTLHVQRACISNFWMVCSLQKSMPKITLRITISLEAICILQTRTTCQCHVSLKGAGANHQRQSLYQYLTIWTLLLVQACTGTILRVKEWCRPGFNSLLDLELAAFTPQLLKNKVWQGFIQKHWNVAKGSFQ